MFNFGMKSCIMGFPFKIKMLDLSTNHSDRELFTFLHFLDFACFMLAYVALAVDICSASSSSSRVSSLCSHIFGKT